jgi:hypothetical protein
MGEVQALGVINGIAARQGRCRLFVYSDRLVLVRGGFGEMMRRTVAMQFGLVGMLIYRLGASSRAAAAEKRRQRSPEQLLVDDPKAVQITVRDIVNAHLSSGLFTAKLSLSLVDGTTPAYSWAKGENQIDQVRGFLRSALGTKLLVDEKKAA